MRGGPLRCSQRKKWAATWQVAAAVNPVVPLVAPDLYFQRFRVIGASDRHLAIYHEP